MSGAGRKKDDWVVDYKKLKIGGSAGDLPRGGLTPIFEDGVLKALVGVGHNGLVITLQLYHQEPATAATARTAPPPASAADDDELPEEELPEETTAGHLSHHRKTTAAWVEEDDDKASSDTNASEHAAACLLEESEAAHNINVTRPGEIAHGPVIGGNGGFIPAASFSLMGKAAFGTDTH